MELGRLYEHLEAQLARFDIRVRSETFDARTFAELSSRGGLCTLHGKRVVVVDASAGLIERVAVLAKAASSLDIENLYIAPQVREAIEAHGAGRSPLPSASSPQPRLRLIKGSRSDDD